MHQIRFRLGLCPRPHWGAYSAAPAPLAGFRVPTSKGKGEGKGGWEGGKRRGRGGGRWSGEGDPQCLFYKSDTELRANIDELTARGLLTILLLPLLAAVTGAGISAADQLVDRVASHTTQLDALSWLPRQQQQQQQHWSWRYGPTGLHDVCRMSHDTLRCR